MKRAFSLMTALGCCLASAASARADLVLTGHEFDGATPSYQVQYDPATYGFGDPPHNTSNTVPYNIYVKSDSNYVYAMWQALPRNPDYPLTSGLPSDLHFVNVYMSTNIPEGSNVGFELENNRAFVPGVPGYHDNLSASGLVILDHLSSPTNDPNFAMGTFYEWAIPWTYFTTDPQGLGFTKLEAGGALQFRISQAFGYNPVYGVDQPDTRLGLLPYAGAVPEPGSLVMASVAVIAGLGFARRRAVAA
jgi:hypothetical protein